MTQPGRSRLEFDTACGWWVNRCSYDRTVTEAIQAATTALLDQNLEALARPHHWSRNWKTIGC